VVPEAVEDVVAILDAFDIESAHVVGTSRGSDVGWRLAAAHPSRVRTFTAVGGPNPLAFVEAAKNDPNQERQLGYQNVLAGPDAEVAVTENNAAWIRRALKPIGARADMYVEAMLSDPGRVTGTVNWYRADDQFDNPMPETQIEVLTTLAWGTRDFVASRAAAEATAQWVAADYRLVALDDITHWVPEEAPDALVEAILERVHWNEAAMPRQSSLTDERLTSL
jgi:pimeloyl-ACP methyl ester carboxylesterase